MIVLERMPLITHDVSVDLALDVIPATSTNVCNFDSP